MTYNTIDHGHFYDTRMCFAYSKMRQKAFNFAQTNDAYPIRVEHWLAESFEEHPLQFIEDESNKFYHLRVVKNNDMHLAKFHWEVSN